MTFELLLVAVAGRFAAGQREEGEEGGAPGQGSGWRQRGTARLEPAICKWKVALACRTQMAQNRHQWEGRYPSLPRDFLLHYTMILQRIRIIEGDAGFEPRTSAPEV